MNCRGVWQFWNKPGDQHRKSSNYLMATGSGQGKYQLLTIEESDFPVKIRHLFISLLVKDDHSDNSGFCSWQYIKFLLQKQLAEAKLRLIYADKSQNCHCTVDKRELRDCRSA